MWRTDLNKISTLWLTLLIAGIGALLFARPVLADGPVPLDTEPGWFSGDVNTAHSLAWGDMDGDGDLDIAIGNAGVYSSTCLCYLGDVNKVYLNEGGILQMAPAWISPDSDATESVAWGDVDGDGDLDLAVGNDGAPNKVYLNQNGVLSVTPVWNDTVDDPTRSIAWGDVNDDGWLDLAVGNYGTSNKVYLNVGGTLATTPWNDGLGSLTTSIAWGDMDSDGDLDLAAGNRYGAQYVYLNVNGVLTTTGLYVSGNTGNTYSVAWGDVDADGDLDLAVGNVGHENWVHLNDGHTLSPSASWISYETDQTTAVAWGDVDGDGFLDLVAASSGQHRVYLAPGKSSVITATWTSSDSDIGTEAAWGDVDGDGDLDLAIASDGSPFKIYYNNGVAFAREPWTADREGVATVDVAWGDIDSDGDLDLAVASYYNYLALYLNENNLLVTPPAWTSDVPLHSRSLAWGDIDGDGDLDLAVGNVEGDNVVYPSQDGMLAIGGPAWTDGASDNTHSVAWGDVDGDGDLDLAVGNAGPWNTTYRCYMGGAPNKLYLNQDGILDTSPAWVSDDSDDTMNLAWGDLDGDGDLDLAAGNGAFGGQTNKVYLNDGGVLQTQPGWVSRESDWTEAIAWGDVDGDGDLDLVVGNYVTPNKVYYNEGGTLQEIAGWASAGSDWTYDIDLGDVDGDGDLDMAVGNASLWPSSAFNTVYLNQGGTFASEASPFSNDSDNTLGVALGDVDGDGDLDLAVANINAAVKVYLNQRPAHPLYPGEFAWAALDLYSNPVPTFDGGVSTALAPADEYATPGIRQSVIPITYTLFNPTGEAMQSLRAFYSSDGGGHWRPAVATSDTVTENLAVGHAAHYAAREGLPLPFGEADQTVISTVQVTETGTLADLDVWVNITHTWDADVSVWLRSPSGPWVELFTGVGDSGDNFEFTTLSDQAFTSIMSGTAPFTGTYRPIGSLSTFNGQSLNGTWMLWASDVFTPADDGVLLGWGLRLRTAGEEHVYQWDVLNSGFFGQSDDIVFRLEANPMPNDSGVAGTYHYTNTIPGPYQRALISAHTYPFRVRGTQVRVMSDTLPVANAVVYRLPAGQQSEGTLIADAAGRPFHTDSQGYLQGRGELNVGDRLLALAPITWTETYTLYYTNGAPTDLGVDAHTVSASGVQTLTVSSDHPLLLFDLNVTLEWDAHNDNAYLDELMFNLQRASEYLYDFTDGQVALRAVNVFQNADEWGYSNVIVRTNNRLRPFAAQGGIVITDTLDPDHNASPDLIRYQPGQVTMGSTWNRYGDPGRDLGEDWALILAHELSHYLLYHDDVYLGLDENGYLKSVSTCQGSAMGDLYDKPANTEFIADPVYWWANCVDTLPAKTLGRYEWETMQLWYPWLHAPILGSENSGPQTMPFDFTEVTVYAPYTPTLPLLDPTFYIDYVGGGSSTSEARAYLLRDEYAINLGSPFGGQNRVVAHGAEPGDRLCVFDQGALQYGCEIIVFGDDHLVLEQDTTWNPVILITPVNSTTIGISVTVDAVLGDPLHARIFPELGYGEPPITLSPAGGTTYTGVFTLTYPAMSGDIQVWVDEPATELNPRRETIIAYSIGGNPGSFRLAGGSFRLAGGSFRLAGGSFRLAGGSFRLAGAPIVSADGQMILFTEDPVDFITGTFFTVQSMAGLPSLPPGRTVIGQGYNLVASPGATLPITSSVSIQYLSHDVEVAGAEESDLTLYYWDGGTWLPLDTVLDTYYNLASAPSQGAGIYVLLASTEISLYGPGWNLISYPIRESRPVTEALLSISGVYTTVYGYESEDPVDPWRVYDVNVPLYVNSLEMLTFGKGYWINVSESITLYMQSSASALTLDNPVPTPPATFYGVVQPGPGFTLVAGMPVQAWIGGNRCGQGWTRTVGDEIVYVVDVWAEDAANAVGCGQVGRHVTFEVGGVVMRPRMPWDIRQLWEVTLSPAQHLYLPVVLRNAP